MIPWIVFGAIGIGSFAFRLSFVLIWSRKAPPEQIVRATALIAPALLAALIASTLASNAGVDVQTLSRFIAIALGAAVAMRTRSMVATVSAGTAAYLALEAGVALGLL